MRTEQVRFFVSTIPAMTDGKLLLDANAIQRSLTRIAHEIAESNADSCSVGLIGIQRGGIYLAGTLASAFLLPFTGGLIDRYRLPGYALAVSALLVGACAYMALVPGPVALVLGIFLPLKSAL